MGCRGVLFALTEEQAKTLLAARNDSEVMDFVEEIEESWAEENLQETDKAWDAMHRCLSDGTLNTAAQNYPLHKCILGGRQLYQADDYIVCFVTPAEVKDVAWGLGNVTEEWLRQRYYKADFPEYQYGEKDERDFECTWDYLELVRELYKKAAGKNRAVIFTVDQ